MSEAQPAIVVRDVYKSFRLPHEQHSGIKQLIVNFWKRKKGYEVQQVLDDISFEVKKGEFFGIVGRNGSGKSTLLKLLAGIYTPDKGGIQINGSMTPFIELGVGFNPELTGRENVYMNGALLGFSNKQMDAMYEEIVEFAELERFMDQKLKNYSSGMQVRLAFAIAIQANTDILLLDEVLAVGDAAFQQKCFDYFEKLKKDKQTIIIVTHDMSAVQRFCTRAMIIENGLIKKIGKPSEIADIYTEDNIEIPETVESEDIKNQKNKYRFSAQVNTEDDFAELSFKYTGSANDSDLYVGFTIFRDGMNIAEINSLNKTMKNGLITYRLDLSQLNPGIYEISGALFEKETRAIQATLHKRKRFKVKGYDSTRGAALKLQDNWQA